MEWKLDSTSYILPIDSIDIDLMSVHQHRGQSDDAALPIPIWSANKPTKEYYNFEVYAESAETVKDHAESDCVQNQNTHPCYICNIDVPTAYIKEHYSSSTHKTLIQITENAMERSRKQISAETFILDAKSDPNFFCTFCVEVVKLRNKNHHNTSKKHLASVKYDEFIQEFATAFMDRDSFIDNLYQNVEESKCSPNVEKIDINQQNIHRESSHSSNPESSKKETANEMVQQNFMENTNLNNNKLALVSQAGNVAPTISVSAKPPKWCNMCNVFVPSGKGSKKRHRRSNEHVYNSSIFRVENGIYHHMKKCRENKLKATCKICQISIPRIKQDVEAHTNSKEHIFKYNRILEENNLIRRKLNNIDEFQLFCSVCHELFLEFTLFEHLNKKKHKKSVLKIHQNRIGKNLNAVHGTGKFEYDDDNFVNDFTTTTFTNSKIVEMSLNQQIKNTNLATRDTASIYILPEPQLIHKEKFFTEQHPVCSPAQSECQANTTRVRVQIENKATSTFQRQNKPTMTKNYIHWLNINKLTPASIINNELYKCGFCNFIMYKAELFDHCNKALHKSNVDKMASLKDCAEVKTETSREDTLTTGVTAKTESPELETAKTELKVGTTIIELTQMDFYHCEVCRNMMPNTETDINAHINSKMHLKNDAKYDKICERNARREKRLNKAIDKNNTEPPSTEVKDEIMSIETPSTSQEIKDKLCKYCKTLIIGGKELSHINSDLHKKNVIETLEHEIPVVDTAAAVSKKEEGSYNCKIIKDAFNDTINKPSTSTQPNLDQSTCKDVNVKQLKPNKADTATVIENDNNYIVILDNISHCQLCNSHITNSVKNINDHAVCRRHKYLASLISPNYIVWGDGKFFCNLCSETVRDQSIFIHIQDVVHKNAKIKYETNRNQKVHDSNSNTSELIFCIICNDNILKSNKQIKKHLNKIHADIMTDISKNYLEKLEARKIYRCQLCSGLLNKKWRALLHVLGEDHLNIFTTQTQVTTVGNEAKSTKGDSLKEIEDKDTTDQKHPQEIEITAGDDDVSKYPEEIFCEICKHTILVKHIRTHFKEAHAVINIILLEEFTIYFEDKGHNMYRCVHCDFMLNGKWKSLKHILGKHHYRLLTQAIETKETIENGTESSKGDLNTLEKRVKEHPFNDPFDDADQIRQDHSPPVHKDRMLEKEAKKGYDIFEEIEQDEISNIQQLKNEEETLIADNWWDLNDDFDDYIVFDDKAGDTDNNSEKYTEVIRKMSRRL